MEYLGQSLRHELKFYINYSVYHTIRNRLRVVAQPDPYMINEDGYLVSSVYFDNMYQSALNDKQSGVRYRKKYRMRSYDRKDNIIKLECKQKFNEYISKSSVSINREQYNSILSGDFDFLKHRDDTVCKQVFAYNKTQLLKPVVTVEYLREAYIFPQGNVRVTFDKEISSSVNKLDMFAPDFSTTKVLEENQIVMEVKFDSFLPSSIREILQTAMTNKCAISKYVMCRIDKRRLLFR